MSTHTAVAITGVGKVEELQLPTLTPGSGEVLIKIAYGALIPPDAYMADLGFFITEYPMVLGFSISGTIAQVGAGVDDLKVGDRIIAFSYLDRKQKATQQYCIQPRTVVGKIPDSLPLEGAGSIPDNLVTAFYTVFNQLAIPIPSSFPPTSPPAHADEPILIYGAGSSAAQYAIQLLNAAGYKKVIATASPHNHEAVTALGAHAVFDYRSPTLAQDIAKFVGGNGKIKRVVDAITAEGTLKIVSEIVDSNGTVAILLPIKRGNALTATKAEDLLLEVPEDSPFAPSVKVIGVRTFFYQQDEFLKENLMPKIIPDLLAKGLVQPNRVRLLDQGTLKERVEAGLELFRTNKVSGEKVVVKIDH